MPVYRIVGVKAQDDKIKTLTIRKQSLAYSTRDISVPEIATKQERIDKKNIERQEDIKLNAFESGLAHAKLHVVFNKKMQDKLPIEIKNMAPKYPREIVLTDVYYVVQDDRLFVNFFSSIELKELRV